ncbi:hypothetical protein EVAR_17011_1 [Eumeta japonica]|uniref:Histone-lysine N-methyltransferase SETMAR n=1 Tax=Eumeta variegata TaxID=151549 RepID=A0A4C1TW01_EUMVA|nr:hypothetical protein EVAR_17011_1 [Eumeta japonica]
MMQRFAGGDSNTVHDIVTADESVEIRAHPPYSANLAPCDFYLFPKIKEELRVKWFTGAEEAVAAHEKAVEMTPEVRVGNVFLSVGEGERASGRRDNEPAFIISPDVPTLPTSHLWSRHAHVVCMSSVYFYVGNCNRSGLCCPPGGAARAMRSPRTYLACVITKQNGKKLASKQKRHQGHSLRAILEKRPVLRHNTVHKLSKVLGKR